MKIIITTLFGLESLVRDELLDLGYEKEQINLFDGQVNLEVENEGIAAAVARTNMWIRTGERILVEVGRFTAQDFDSFFDGVEAIQWSEFIPPRYAFHISGYSRKSILFGVSACQSLAKKAIVNKLVQNNYPVEEGNLVENAMEGLLKIQFSIIQDIVSLMIDTSGDGLHKRGYRPLSNVAPIKETLGSALSVLSRYQAFGMEALVDPFCGSGTIVIEAAMRAYNIAPGLTRTFAAARWPFIGETAFSLAKAEAFDLMDIEGGEDCYFFGSDLDMQAVDIAWRNAKLAGVEKLVSFRQGNAFRLDSPNLQQWTKMPRQLIICNPPYGERLLSEEEAWKIYQDIGTTFLDHQGFCKKGFRLSVITPEEEFESAMGRKADKRRKLYNGNIKCQMYHYHKMLK